MTETIQCRCGNVILKSEARYRAASGKKLSRPECKDCNERAVRTFRETKALGVTSDWRR